MDRPRASTTGAMTPDSPRHEIRKCFTHKLSVKGDSPLTVNGLPRGRGTLLEAKNDFHSADIDAGRNVADRVRVPLDFLEDGMFASSRGERAWPVKICSARRALICSGSLPARLW